VTDLLHRVVSESPPATIVSTAGIVGRMDADYYRPIYVINEGRLRDGPFDIGLLGDIITKGNYGSLPDSVDYAQDGVPLIRGTDLRSMSVTLESAVRVPRTYLDKFKKARVQPGDLLMLAKGASIDRPDSIAMYPSSGPEALANGSIFVMRPDPKKVNTHFLLGYLASDFLLLQKRRVSTNTGALYNDIGSISGFLVPLPERQVQDYIGAKVELAERCRGLADRLRGEANDRFSQLLDTRSFRPTRFLTNLIDTRQLSERLTSQFYLPRYFDLDAHLRSLGLPVTPVARVLRERIIRSSTPERTEDGAVPCILTSDIDPHEIRWRQPSLRVTPSVHDGHGGRLEPMDVVYTSVGPPVGEAAVVLKEFLPMAVGGDVSILRHSEALHPGFLSLFLNSVFGQMQNDRYSRGIRQRRVYPEDIGAFLIPVLSRDDQAFIGDRVVRYQALSERAVDLVNEAKADVKALIEGALDTKAILSGRLKPPTEEEVLGA
jgi:type I restriction enzyme S subunit